MIYLSISSRETKRKTNRNEPYLYFACRSGAACGSFPQVFERARLQEEDPRGKSRRAVVHDEAVAQRLSAERTPAGGVGRAGFKGGPDPSRGPARGRGVGALREKIDGLVGKLEETPPTPFLEKGGTPSFLKREGGGEFQSDKF